VARFGTIRRLLQAAGTSYPNWSDLVLEKFRQLGSAISSPIIVCIATTNIGAMQVVF
jgi:hypothetical protein